MAAPLARAEANPAGESEGAFYRRLAKRLHAVHISNPVAAAERALLVAKQPDPLGLPIDGESVQRKLRTLQRVDGSGVKDTRMRAYEDLVRQTAPHQPLHNIRVVADTHLVEDWQTVFESLVDAGAFHAELLLKGSRHSQRESVIDALKRQGLHVMPARAQQSEAEYRQVLMAILKQAHADPKAKFLVLGHGGKLHAMLTHALVKGLAPANLDQRLVVIETTTKGRKRLARYAEKQRAKGLPHRLVSERFPYVDIGDYWAKLSYESPAIGLNCAEALHEHLRSLVRRQALSAGEARRPVLIWGYGNVGRTTARYLQRLGYQVHVYDKAFATDRKLLQRALRAGFTAHRSASAALGSGSGTIAAATGEDPFAGGIAAGIADRTVVFNLASPGELDGLVAASREAPDGRFGARPLAQLAVPKDHYDLVRRIAGKEILLARGSQVINLAAGWTVRPEVIQLTTGLAWSAIQRAVSLFGQKGGRYALDDGAMRRFVNAVDADLAAHKLGSLQNPSVKAFRNHVRNTRRKDAAWGYPAPRAPAVRSRRLRAGGRR